MHTDTDTDTHIHAWASVLISIITVKIAHLPSFRGQSRLVDMIASQLANQETMGQ